MTNLFKIGLGDWNAFQGDLAQVGYAVEDIKFLRGNEKVLKETLEVIRRAQAPVTKLTEIAIWRTVEIGRRKNAEAMLEALKVVRRRVSDWADRALAKTEFAEELRTLELVAITVAELGFPKGASLKQILDAGIARGYELCPAEVGPALREQYADQPVGEWLRIAMESINVSGGNLGIFKVGHRGVDLWLDACSGHLDGGWSPGVRFVFVRSKR